MFPDPAGRTLYGVTHCPANTQNLTGTKQDLALVGVHLRPHDRLVARLLARFAELRWQVVDLNAYYTHLPSQVRLAGAMLRALPTDPLTQLMLQQGVPAVRLGDLPHPDDHRVPAIIPDQAAAGRLAADHFFERGFSQLAFVRRDPWSDRRLLYEGFRQRAEQLGCHCHLLALKEDEVKSKVTPERHLREVQRQCVCQWWKTLPLPVGLLASGDMAAHRYCQWAIQADLRVPEDLAVLGVGNLALTCEGALVPLSSIDPDHPAALDIAIDTLRRLMAGEPVEQPTIHIPPRTVVTRRSTDVLAATNPNVVKALRFMWNHVTQDLSVDQIARHVGVSRRTLEVAFQRDLGRGINAEFQRRRMEKGRDLLLQTDWRIAQIAEFLGFNGLKYFSKAFRAAYGASPVQYRRNAANSP